MIVQRIGDGVKKGSLARAGVAGNEVQPVSIKMAKEQGLSLNPTKISGACGRLMCCLAYEESAYEYLNSIMPMVGSTVRTPDGLGTVLEVNPVSGYLRVRCGTESLSPRYYKVGVCEYISGGKRAPRRRTGGPGRPAAGRRPAAVCDHAVNSHFVQNIRLFLWKSHRFAFQKSSF